MMLFLKDKSSEFQKSRAFLWAVYSDITLQKVRFFKQVSLSESDNSCLLWRLMRRIKQRSQDLQQLREARLHTWSMDCVDSLHKSLWYRNKNENSFCHQSSYMWWELPCNKPNHFLFQLPEQSLPDKVL